MLVVDGVSKSYGSLSVLQGISFALQSGQIVGLLGLNGAGKSTLLKGLSTVQRFDDGKVKLDGVELQQELYRYKSLVGYQPESESLHSAMTPYEHLNFFGQLRGIKRRERRLRIEELLEALTLQHLRDAPCRELSQGEKQRVSFALATLHQPRLLLLDEPTRGLDPVQLAFFRKTVIDHKASRITLLSTHQLHEVRNLCDVAVVLSGGKVNVFERELFDELLGDDSFGTSEAEVAARSKDQSEHNSEKRVSS